MRLCWHGGRATTKGIVRHRESTWCAVRTWQRSVCESVCVCACAASHFERSLTFALFNVSTCRRARALFPFCFIVKSSKHQAMLSFSTSLTSFSVVVLSLLRQSQLCARACVENRDCCVAFKTMCRSRQLAASRVHYLRQSDDTLFLIRVHCNAVACRWCSNGQWYPFVGNEPANGKLLLLKWGTVNTVQCTGCTNTIASRVFSIFTEFIRIRCALMWARACLHILRCDGIYCKSCSCVH